MKTCFSEEKLIKQFGNPPFSPLTPLCQISKTRSPPLILETMTAYGFIVICHLNVVYVALN